MSTIQDVAKEADVSVATVSRVINQKGPIAPVTKQRVNAAIAKLNYHPNVWGRRLRRQESRMILIFVPNIYNPYYSAIVSGVEDTARINNYGTMLCITNGDEKRENEFIKLLYNGQADGAIMMNVKKNDTNISQLGLEVPIVQCCEFCTDKNIAHVSIDNFAASKQVVQYLISLGHKKIGFIGSVNQYISSERRQSGYEEALKEADFPACKDLIAYADEDYTFSSGVRATKELLSKKNRPTAIFCISDVLALGTIKAASELGIEINKDLSVVGFDDVEYATMFQPMLTTVSQPRYSLGKTSAEILIKQIETDEKSGRIYLEHKIILRDSTARF